MSKWLNKEKFEKFKNERMNDNEPVNDIQFARKWPNPKMGTQSKPKEYVVRLLPDTEGEFYKKIKYHMFKSGENWYFIMCPKTHNQENYCPWCQATQLLYQGSSADKKAASNYKRKEKFVGNIFVIKDPRDVDENDEDRKTAGKTFLYEFPAVVEQQIKKELIDDENGWGADIFDPEDGYNMILRIGAKKPDKNGKIWPDYGQSTFSKKSSSIASYTDETVDEIMETIQSIDEYIENSMWSVEKHEKILKTEMLWEDVEEDFIKNFNSSTSKDTESEEETNNESETENTKTKEEKPSKSTEDVDISDEELLAELDNM
jgi:hypothetical protein